MSKTRLICAHKNMPVSAAATSMTVVWNLRVLNIVCPIGSTVSPLHVTKFSNSKDNSFFTSCHCGELFSWFVVYIEWSWLICCLLREAIESQMSFAKYADDCEPVEQHFSISVKLSLYRYRHTYIPLYTCTARMCVFHTSKRQLLKDLRLCFLRWILFYVNLASCTYLFWWLQLRGNALEGSA